MYVVLYYSRYIYPQGGTPGNSWWCVPPKIVTLFQTKKCHFPPRPFSDQASKTHNLFQIWSLRNYVIITQIKTQNKRFLKIHFEFVCYTLSFSSSFFLSVNFGTEITNTFIHSRSSMPKWAKCRPVFRPTEKNHTFWDGTYLYGLDKGITPGRFTVEELQPAQEAFPFGFGAKKDRGMVFQVLAAREMKQEPKK